MKKSLKLALPIAALMCACLAKAADMPAPPLPAISVQAVTTEDPTGYATWVGMANDKLKAAGGPDRFTHVYTGVFAGQETGMVFAVRGADSFSDLSKTIESIMKSTDRLEVMNHLNTIRKLGSAMLLKAAYYEGGYDGEWILVTDVIVKDETAYVAAIKNLRGLLDTHDMKDIKVNVYRVTAGRDTHTHEVVISAPTAERQAAFLDTMDTPAMKEWMGSLSSLRTVVHNGTYHDITK